MDKGDDYTVTELLDNSERAVNKMREYIRTQRTR